MHDAFVPLDAFFRRLSRDASSLAVAVELSPSPGLAGVGEDAAADQTAAEIADALSAVRRFRAALADAVTVAADEVVGEIARDVLARELVLTPADIAAVAAAALERCVADAPIRLRAHPDEIGALASLGIEIVGDARLRRGDVAIDVRSGTIDASLDARLECVLASR